MTLASIASIKESKENLKTANKSIKTWKIEDQKFGPESEYTGRAIKAGTDAILLDINALLKSENQLIKITTSAERTEISSRINGLANALIARDGGSAAAWIDSIKTYFRPFNIRNTENRISSFTEACDNLQRASTELSILIEQNKEELNKLSESTNNTSNLATKLQKQSEVLAEQFNETQERLNALTKTEEDASSLHSSISDLEKKASSLLAQVSEKNALIENFAKKIAQREGKIEDQQQKTEHYNSTLKTFEQEHSELIAKGKELIEKSREALGYSTAQGLSAAFHEQHLLAKADWAIKGWVISGALFMLASIGIGLWVAVDSTDNSIEFIIARLSLIPLCVASAWFSASQYVKLRNLAEDYAYKTALAKSLVGFSEQIRQSENNTEAHSTYLERVLNEIHKDPLRSRKSVKNEPDIKNTIDQLKSSLESVSSALKIFSQKTD